MIFLGEAIAPPIFSPKDLAHIYDKHEVVETLEKEEKKLIK